MNKVHIIGIVVGLIIMVAGLVLTAISKLATIDPNPYLSTINVSGVVYAVIFGIGFIAFVTFLQLMVEDRIESKK